MAGVCAFRLGRVPNMRSGIMINTVLIFIGCGLGGLCRYWASNAIYLWLGKAFPLGTLFVNVSGSFLMGFLFMRIIANYEAIGQPLRALLLIGFLGGYTTFSSFSMETLALLENGEITSAVLNIILSFLLCLSAVWIGALLGRQ